MAYIAMSINSNIKVSKFITLGSPLFARNFDITNITESALAGYFTDKTRRLENAKKWRNYWADCDNISGVIPLKKVENIEVQPDNFCHSAYYNDFDTWELIMMDIYTSKKQQSKR